MKKWLALAFAAGLVAVDQLIKLWARQSLLPLYQIKVIPGLFNLTYVENRGAAFGIFQGQTAILTAISGALLVIIALAIALDRFKSNFLLWTVSIGLAGGIGNLIDRASRGYVVDYLDFSSIFGFPVFNFADCCVVIATFFILAYFFKTEMKPKSGGNANDMEEA